MAESLNNELTIREYLLGRIVDEATIDAIEERLFTDDEFCSRVLLAEDSIINDYVLGRMSEADVESFRASLSQNADRALKLELTEALKAKALSREMEASAEPSFFTSLASWFRQPAYAGAFAVLVVGALAAVIYFTRGTRTEPLAELRSIYQHSRPTESRISEFSYAPLTQLRGEPGPDEVRRLRRIENSLIEETEENSNSQTHHALGVFYLTQRQYIDAIKELEIALQPGTQGARIHNDLGVAHFERAKTDPPEKRLENLAKSLEAFTKATETDSNLLEALFNRSLTLQEMGMPREARDSWNLYLQKDASSPWAGEARKHLAKIVEETTLFRPSDEILTDFLNAYRQRDDTRAKQIHNETKGLLSSLSVPLQLSRRYLVALQTGAKLEADESIRALTYLGELDHGENDDPFFLELARFYSTTHEKNIESLLNAKDVFDRAHQLIGTDYEQAQTHFESSRDLFAATGDTWEAAIAESWAAQLLPDMARIEESRRRLNSLLEAAEARTFSVLAAPAYYWLAVCDYRQNEISASNKKFKAALGIATKTHNAFEMHHANEALTLNYSQLGELDHAMQFAGKMLAEDRSYYQSQNQYWRDKGTLADLSRKLSFFSTALHLSRERLAIARQQWPTDARINDSLRQMIFAAFAKNDVDAALKYGYESLNVAQARPPVAEKARTIAELYLLIGDIRSRSKHCTQALVDYDQSLEIYGQLPEIIDNLYRVHKGKLFCFQQLDQQPAFDQQLTTVLTLSEKYRQTIREDSSRQTFFSNEQIVFDTAIENAISNGDPRRALELSEESKSRSLLDVVASGKSIAEVERSFGPAARPLSLTEIQTRLPDDLELVQYAVLADSLAVWIVSRHGFDFYERRVAADALEQQVAAFQSLILNRRPLADIKQAGRALHQLLIPKQVSGDKQLCIVADKSLHRLAFNTLVTPDGTYMLQAQPLLYAPSASLLVLATENGERKSNVTEETLLSVGNPDFDREENPNLPGLPAAETEANAITNNYPKAITLVNRAATRNKFLSELANVEVVHFAGHFVANQQSPGNSKLLFAGGDLRSSELSEYKLPRAKLVVLSACETGVERSSKSEGAIGIARTLLALGAPVVVASQWKVDSEPTKDLMIAFHRGRREGLTTSQSLRRAQLEMLARNDTSAPFYWAAFSVFGGHANY